MVTSTGGAPIEKCHERAEGRVHGTQVIGNVTGSDERRAARMATEIHQATHRKSDDVWSFEIAIGSGLSETGNRGHHQSRIDGLERAIAELESIEIARRLVFNQHIGMTHELTKRFPTFVLFQVENDAAFVRMVRGERQTLLGIELAAFKRSLAAHGIAARWLDENHLCAEIGKEETAIPAHATGEIQDAQAG